MDRWRGALAGLTPAGAVGVLFLVSGSEASAGQIALSLGLVTLIATSAGWLAGPLAVGDRRFLVPVLGYAIALIATTVAISLVQAAGDVVSGTGLDPIAIVGAVAGRVIYGVASITYLSIPAIVLGAAWTIAARGLILVAAGRTSGP